MRIRHHYDDKYHLWRFTEANNAGLMSNFSLKKSMPSRTRSALLKLVNLFRFQLFTEAENLINFRIYWIPS